MSFRSRIALVRAARPDVAPSSDAPPRRAPDEIQLWDVGANPTDYGVHMWTAKSASLVAAEYETRGNPFSIDVEHTGSTLENGQPAPTAGYARLEIRAGAPWLVFSWSAYGRAQIETGERLFLSPEYAVNKATGEIVGLDRVSLVASPGTHRARVLAAKKENEMDLAIFLAALRAALGADDPKPGISSLIDEVERAAGGGAADSGPPSSGEVEAAGTDNAAGVEASDEEDPNKAPVAASDDPKDAPIAAAAPKAKASAPKPGAAPSSAGAEVAQIAASAISDVERVTRDMLLEKYGDRLDKSIARWAASQPLATVRGLVAAAPPAKKPEAPGRVAATRGAGQVDATNVVGSMPDRDREDLDRSMGIVKASARKVERTETKLVIPTMPGDQIREFIAASKKEGSK